MAEKKLAVKWPATAVQLEAAGYQPANRAFCSGRRCQQAIWWWTTPAGKRIPLHECDGSAEAPVYQPHWADCVDAPSFKR